MKLENDQAFCDPSVGLAHDSKPSQYKENNLESDGPESINQKQKKGNTIFVDLTSNEWDLDISPIDIKAGSGFITSKIDCPMSIVNLKDDVDENISRVAAPAHSSHDVEFEKSLDAPLPHHPQDEESFDNVPDIYMDKNIMECEVPELIVCYKESSNHVIKDICVDEGIPAKDKILFENLVDEKAVCTFMPPEKDSEKETLKDADRMNMPSKDALDPSPEEDVEKVFSKRYLSKDLMQANDDSNDKLDEDLYKEPDFSGENTTEQNSDSQHLESSVGKDEKFRENSLQISSKPTLCSEPEESKRESDEKVMETAPLESTTDESNINGVGNDYNSLLENGSITFHFDSSDPAGCHGEGSQEVFDSKSVFTDQVMSDPIEGKSSTENGSAQLGESSLSAVVSLSTLLGYSGRAANSDNQVIPEITNGRSDSNRVASLLQHNLGESSFSAPGSLSNRINYSEPVPYSGSISLRSDSSTTSARSFAFPILQSEWNSSPVRMAKADRRHYRKQRGWGQSFLCCRF